MDRGMVCSLGLFIGSGSQKTTKILVCIFCLPVGTQTTGPTEGGGNGPWGGLWVGMTCPSPSSGRAGNAQK